MNHRNKELKWVDMEWLQQYCQTCTAVGAEAARGTKFEQDGITFFGGTQIPGLQVLRLHARRAVQQR